MVLRRWVSWRASTSQLMTLWTLDFGLYTHLELELALVPIILRPNIFNGGCLQRSQVAKSLKAHRGGRSAGGEQGKNEAKSLQNLPVFIFSAWFLCSQDSHVISKST